MEKLPKDLKFSNQEYIIRLTTGDVLRGFVLNEIDDKDNGIGIDSTYFERIFKVFTKLESNNSSSGIGLSIVKKIVQFYNGEVWLESEKEIGTTFYFTIPKSLWSNPI